MRVMDWIGVGVVAVIFTPAVLAMSAVWDSVDHYSHGYMIPLVALWAASAQRAVLPGLPAGRDPRGLAVLGLATVLHLVGMLGGLVWLSGLSVVVAVAGTVLYLKGLEWLRSLAFAIGFLLFMVPIPSTLLTPVIVKLQLFVSTIGVGLLRGMGQPVFREGNVIHLPGNEELFVAEACSGITSLVTLLPLGVFLAHFTERSRARQVLLVLTVVPVAMLGNLVRVVGTVLAAGRIGAERATSSALHDWVGIFTYVLACIVLLGVGTLLRRFSTPERAGVVP